MDIHNIIRTVNPTPPELFKFITENVTDFVGICDAEFIPIYVNKEGLKMIGLDSMEEVLQIPATDFFFPEDVDFMVNEFFPSVLKSGRSECEIRFRHFKTGEALWMIYNVVALHDDNGNATGYATISKNITERKRISDALKESNARFLNNIKHAPVAMCVFRGKDHVVEVANERILELWGTTEGNVLDKPIFEALPDARHQGLEQVVDGVYTTGEKFVADERPVTLLRNGVLETLYVNFVVEALHESDGTISGVFAVAIDVTEQVKSRQQSETSKAHFRSLIEQSPMASVIFKGPELLIEIANNAMLKRWNKTAAEVENKTLEEVFPFVKDQKYPGLLREVFKTGKVYRESGAVSNIKDRGEDVTTYVDFEYSPLFDADGNVSGVISTVIDVTDKVESRKRLEESEKKFRLLADSMPQYIWTSDPEGNLNYFNKSVFEYTGLTPEQVEKDGWIQIVHPDDRERNIKEWNQAIATGNDFILEHRFRKHNGEYRWQLSRAIPQKDEQGKIMMWVGTSTDIQDQKNFRVELEKQVKERTSELLLANELLKKSESRYHLMVEEVQDYAILYLNREGIVENWNAGAEKIKGYKAEEIVGRSFTNFYTEEDQKNRMPFKLLAEAAHEGKARQEGWRVRKDGTWFWASVTITAVHDENNNVIGFSKVTHDLTQKKNADDELKRNAALLEQKNTDLEKMNKELQSFAYISSHDLQEPLRKIQTFVTRILETEEKNLTDKGKDYFNRMQDAAVRMRTLIDDLLTYSRTNSSERKLEKTDLNKIVENVKGELKEELQQKHAIVETYGLPVIDVIPFQFRQLLHNLFTNSLKFSKENQPPIIKITSEIITGAIIDHDKISPTAKYCHIIFSDNGIGFEQEFNEKIFELFQRLHGRQEYNGTGIGLAIVKKIIENHNGIITATGEPNKGASFDIYIPV